MKKTLSDLTRELNQTKKTMRAYADYKRPPLIQT